MIGYLKRKFRKIAIKKTFKEYPYKLKIFNLPNFGPIEYAQWEHPFESEKTIMLEDVDFLKLFIKKGDLAIDIGAHTGDTTIPIALAAGKEGIVLALEPNKYVCKVLNQNAKLNGHLTNIVPLNFAAADEDGIITFNYSDASFCNGGFLSQIKNKNHNHNYSLEVEAKNIQKFLEENYPQELPKLSYIKIDAEGYDKEIIRTIQTLLKKYNPVVITECYKRLTREERREFFDYLTAPGYLLFRLDGYSLKSIVPIINANDMNTKKHFDILAIPENRTDLLNLMQS
jgi:FkbM family methyltransferase